LFTGKVNGQFGPKKFLPQYVFWLRGLQIYTQPQPIYLRWTPKLRCFPEHSKHIHIPYDTLTH
ncbi:MAG: hypothetical protein AAF242_06690, partial [Bacteroidota bacterium]